MKMTLTRAPAREPVSLAEIAEGLDEAGPVDMTLLACLATAARIVCEARLGILFLAQDWTLLIEDAGGRYDLDLALGPVRRIHGARMRAADGRVERVDTADLELVMSGAGHALRRADGAPWPRGCDRVEVDVTVGLAETPAELPRSLRACVAELARHWFIHKTPVAFGDRTVPVPNEVAARLGSFTHGS